jgi:hypothetical protein
MTETSVRFDKNYLDIVGLKIENTRLEAANTIEFRRGLEAAAKWHEKEKTELDRLLATGNANSHGEISMVMERRWSENAARAIRNLKGE